MLNEILDAVKQRKDFYRNNYRGALTALMISLFVILGLIVAIMYVVLTYPPREFYATSNVGGVRPLQALDAPNTLDKPLIE